MDPAYEGLYGRRTSDRILRVHPEFAQNWYERTKDLVDKYDPDLLYFDGPLPNGDYGRHLAAHYYNKHISADGTQTGVITIKRDRDGFTRLRECSGVDEMQSRPFMVETTINPGWFYMGGRLNINEHGGDSGMASVSGADTSDKLRMTAGQVIDLLVDVVSKNGNLMLNVGLRADGSLPETFRSELDKIGAWLKLNGEAIFDTRPYKVFGEGPFSTANVGAGLSDKKRAYADYMYSYGKDDIRFTTKDGNIYVIVLDWPGDGAVIRVNSLDKADIAAIKSVTNLADGKPLKWRADDGLYITMPEKATGQYAYAFKIIKTAR